MDAAQMADEDARLYLRGKVDRPLGVPQPLVVLAGVERRGLEEIWRRMHDTHGQRAKVMRRADFDDALVDRFQDAGHQGDPDTVAQFHVFESDVGHLPGHRIAVGMTVRAPAAGKRKHRLHFTKTSKIPSRCTQKESRAPDDRERG